MATIFHVAQVDLPECAVVHIRMNKKIATSTQSPAYTINKLCRNFLSDPAFSSCLIAPKRKNEELLVVGLGAVLSTEVFTEWLARENLTVLSRLAAASADIMAAMRFSLAFFLEAEGWYRVGDCFMKGTFLHGEKNSQAKISFDPLCSSVGAICFKVNVDFVSIRVLEPWMYKRPGEAPLLQQSVFCLPKLGCGRILAMHRSLPPTSPFGTYKDMRDYWKISYGYDLPKAQPEAYYDVYFNGSLRPFLYPYFCVLAEKPNPILYREGRERTEAAFENFTTALTASVKTICGQKTHFLEQCGEEARIQAFLARTAPVSKIRKPNKEKRPSLMDQMMSNLPPRKTPLIDGQEDDVIRSQEGSRGHDSRSFQKATASVISPPSQRIVVDGPDDSPPPSKKKQLGARVMTGKSLFAESVFIRPFAGGFKTPAKVPGSRPSFAAPVKRTQNSGNEVASKRFRRPIVE